MSSPSQHIGSRIRIQRGMMRISQDELGKMLSPSVSQQVMSKMERGGKQPSASQIFQLAHYLEVPVSYFFEGLVMPKS